MNRSQKILINRNELSTDKHIKVQLEQEIDTLEFLTMSIDTKDIYRSFNADFGVLVGRVVANENVGVPNAKVSIFIPLSDEDINDVNITSIYPYTSPRDTNIDGKRYNLLPRVSIIDPKTNLVKPKQPFGSFPIKEEIVTNVNFLNVYKKYYKYTALTNNSGDYMIFGVPIGTQIVHMSVDITDIGKYSMTPASMVTNLGYSPNLFVDNNTRIKGSVDINNLPHIETQEISVDIVPFWGDVENFEIGITRQDFRIRATLNTTFIVFGNVFTDGSDSMWGADYLSGGAKVGELYRIYGNADSNLGISSKRIGNITEQIYYYPSYITDYDIDNNIVGSEEMLLLDKSEYSIYKRDGDFVFIISCNRNKIITDSNGNEIVVNDSTFGGIHTEFRGFITLEVTPEDLPMGFTDLLGTNTNEIYPFRFKIKIPQYAPQNEGFNASNSNTGSTQTWRNQHMKFSGGNFYSVAKFNGIVFNDTNSTDITVNGRFEQNDIINTYYTGIDPYNMTGIIIGNDSEDTIPTNINGTTFGGNWLNFSVYLPQMGYLANGESFTGRDVRVNTNFTDVLSERHFNIDNSQLIAGIYENTKWFSRSDLHYTDFIKVPTDDILLFLDIPEKGMTLTNEFVGTDYKNGQTNYGFPYIGQGGKVNMETTVTDTNFYFYKGVKESNCIKYLRELNLI